MANGQIQLFENNKLMGIIGTFQEYVLEEVFAAQKNKRERTTT